MAVQTIRGSTVDGSSGILLEGAVDETGNSHPLPFGVSTGNKSTFAETARTGLTGADAPTGGDMTSGGFGTSLVDTGNALNVQLRATCSVASASLTGRLVFYDESGTPVCIGISPSMTFTSDATLRLGNASGDFICAMADAVDCKAARNVRFFVDIVSSGTWAIYVRPI